MEQINFHFRQGNEHRFAYDFRSLHHAFSVAGFDEIRRRDHKSDFDCDKWIDSGTLYVEAVKPIRKSGGQ